MTEGGADVGVAKKMLSRWPGVADEPPTPMTADWLVNVMSNSEYNILADRAKTKPLIQKAPDLLRKIEKNKEAFEPQVVALGPIHHENPQLKAMEDYKKVYAKRFIPDTPESIYFFYNKVREVTKAAKECYDLSSFDQHHSVHKLWANEEAVTSMMFFDACFLLHFIDLIVKQQFNETMMNYAVINIIIRDMFLLENQIPLMVLRTLMMLKPVSVDIVTFVDMIASVEPGNPAKSADVLRCHFHLLDLLRTRLLGPEELMPKTDEQQSVGNSEFQTTARGLSEAGIKFKKSQTNFLWDVSFRKGCIYSHLSLPPIGIDDHTKSRFLNLIALETCPDSNSGYWITNYVCLLDCLIDTDLDAKVLRSEGVINNALGNDQQVAELVNDLAKYLTADNRAYGKAIEGINQHYNCKFKVDTVRVWRTHCSSYWTTISFVAGFLLLILTTIQTLSAFFPINWKL